MKNWSAAYKSEWEKRSHAVWFDKTEIKFGDEWPHAITMAFAEQPRVVLLLEAFPRDPGVCLDEIAIATGAKSGSIRRPGRQRRCRLRR